MFNHRSNEWKMCEENERKNEFQIQDHRQRNR